MLHSRNRSQVFSVISKILTHSEDLAYEDRTVVGMHESLQSFLNKVSKIQRTSEDVKVFFSVLNLSKISKVVSVLIFN